MSEKELQEKVMMYRVIEGRMEALIKQRDLFLNKIVELQNTVASIDEIANTKEDILFSIGSEAYSFGKASDNRKIIVEVGAGVALEKTFDEAKDTIGKRQDDIASAVNEIQQDIQKLSFALDELEPEIQSLMHEGHAHTEQEAG